MYFASLLLLVVVPVLLLGKDGSVGDARAGAWLPFPFLFSLARAAWVVEGFSWLASETKLDDC